MYYWILFQYLPTVLLLFMIHFVMTKHDVQVAVTEVVLWCGHGDEDVTLGLFPLGMVDVIEVGQGQHGRELFLVEGRFGDDLWRN